MESDIETGRPAPETNPPRLAPRASQWLWHPWYAKLWWAGVGLYWTGKLASFWIVSVGAAYAMAVAGWLNILFYPPTALLVLGLGFVIEWMGYHGWEFGPPTRDRPFPKRSVGGFLDPLADPLDPRSPKYSRRHHRR